MMSLRVFSLFLHFLRFIGLLMGAFVFILMIMVRMPPSVSSTSIIDATKYLTQSRNLQIVGEVVDQPSSSAFMSSGRIDDEEPSAVRKLAPDDMESDPSRMRDTSGTCPETGRIRAFVLDARNDGRGHPSLREASPLKSQIFNCLPNVPCKLVVNGYGLKSGDSIVVASGADTECPPTSAVAKVQSHRQIRTSSLVVFDSFAQPLARETNLVIFDIGNLPDGIYSLCYSSSLAKRGTEAELKDHIYKAGRLDVGRGLFSCDFDLDMCGMSSYTDHESVDLAWKRQSGATEVLGTGPSFDHTEGSEGNGFYIYMASPQFIPGAVGTLLAPPFIYPNGLYCLRFSYHMYGDDVNSMRLYVSRLVDDQDVTGDWGTPNWVRVGDNGDEWVEGGFEFQSDGEVVSEVVIEALSGISEKADIALDDMKITTGKCPEELKRKFYNDEFICGEVRLVSGNWSEDKAWFLEGAVSCAGRGYSYDQLKGGWVPCCVPTYGEYTLVLKDRFGDGWSGSQIQFRFFDQLMTFGEDFDREAGNEKKYNMIIGQLQISRAEADENSINLEVSVMKPKAFVWCGAAFAGAPAPSVELVKKYGIRSKNPSNVKGEKIRLSISNVEGNVRMLEKNTLYDVYCYAESASESLSSDVLVGMYQPMSNSQVKASKVRVTTDSTPPVLEIRGLNVEMYKIDMFFYVNEAATVWCLAADDLESGATPTVTRIKEQGTKTHVSSDKAQEYNEDFITEPLKLTLLRLMPDTIYNIVCYAEDTALPEPNRQTAEQIRLNMREIVSKSKTPSLSIGSYKAFARGFSIFVQVDVPGNVWCGAAPAGSPYPSRADVRNVGATAEVLDTSKSVELEIRGVPQNTRYTVYCFASSKNGNREMSDSQMWDTALEVTSFGKFCELPVEPKAVADGKPTPFDPITPTEQFLVRDFITSQRELGLEGVYRITQLPIKSEVIDYLDNGGPFPKRYARVRAGTCVYGKGAYTQYRVGPLDSGNQREMTYEVLGEPVITDCGGYTPDGVFGRRLLDLHHEDDLSNLLEESFGYAFGEAKCKDMAEKKCLDFGPLVYERPDPTAMNLTTENAKNTNNEPRHSHTWVGLKTPEGDHVPFYFVFRAPTLNMNDPRDEKVKEALLNHHLMNVDAYWYDGKMFDSLDQLLDAYTSSKIERVTPEVLAVRKLKAQEEHANEKRQRRLEEESMAAGTKKRRLAPGPNPLGREGLEYRLAPEHVEPEGKRFTIRSSPGVESYTISYAGWEVIVNNDRDTALRLWNLKFNGIRVAYEMGLMEALAHYSVAERNWYFLDSWYGGLGSAARKLHPGVECPSTGVTIFWDDSLCVFELDMGRPIRSHWKSGELRDGAPQLALVIRQMLTVSNYDYLTDYVFHLSGTLEGTVSFTGELYAGVEVPWFTSRQKNFGTQVTGSMRMGALHNHFAVWKIDFDIDGDAEDNSIFYKEVVPDPIRPGAHKVNAWYGETEEDGYLMFNGTRPLHYYVVNEDHLVYGNVGGYLVKPIQTISIPVPEFEVYSGPAAWTKYRIMTSVRKENELDSTLPRDNKYAARPAVDIDRYIADKDSIRHNDLVTWISDGIWHLAVIEDMPLTVCIGNTLGWMIKPANFFSEDPTMDLHNAIFGDLRDPGTCAIIRNERMMTF